jgi:hypothetical protein
LRLFRRTRREEPSAEEIPSPFDSQGRLRLQCWYCLDQIEYQGFDPCAVVLIANWGDKNRQREQQFFAHAECFRASGSGEELHILDPDFERG